MDSPLPPVLLHLPTHIRRSSGEYDEQPDHFTLDLSEFTLQVSRPSDTKKDLFVPSMTWSDDVHASRLAQSLSTARVERSLKRRNRPVIIRENSGPVPAIAIVAAAASYLLIQRHRAAWEAIKWKDPPIIKQFHALVFGSGGTKLGTASSKAKSTTASQNRKRPTKSAPTPPSSSIEAQTPAQAAGAAAAARSEATARGSPPPPQAPKQTASVPSKVIHMYLMCWLIHKSLPQ